MNTIRRFFCLAAILPSVAFAQSKPADSKPIPVIPQEVIQEILKAQPKIALPQLNPQRVQIRPRLRNMQVEPLILWRRGQDVTGRFTSEKDFATFIDEEIKAIEARFKLNEAAIRKLRVAGKGVAHRAKRPKAEPKKRGPNEPIVLVLGIGRQVTDLSPTFRTRLNKSKLWNKTLEKVLTEKQRAEWKNADAVPTVPTLPELPGVIVLPNGK